MAGDSTAERMASSTVTNSTTIVSSQVEVMSQSFKDFAANSSVEDAKKNAEIDQWINNALLEPVMEVPTVAGELRETPAKDVKQVVEKPYDKSDARPIFHFSNCSDFKFSFGK